MKIYISFFCLLAEIACFFQAAQYSSDKNFIAAIFYAIACIYFSMQQKD